MTAIHETAYPRVRSSITEKELVEIYTPEKDEIEFINKNAKKDSSKLGLLILLKLFQRLGYFPNINDIPFQIIDYIGVVAGFKNIKSNIKIYSKIKYRWLHMSIIRDYLNIKAFSNGGKEFMLEVMLKASHFKDIIADIINVAIEEMVAQRYELPAFSTFLRIASDSRSAVNKMFYQNIYNQLDESYKESLGILLKCEESESTSPWDKLKQDPGRPTVYQVRKFIVYLTWLKSLKKSNIILENIPESKFKRFVEEAKSLNVAQMNDIYEHKRFTLAVSLIHSQIIQAFDDLAEMFIRRVRTLHNTANKALEKYQTSHQDIADYLIEALGKIAENWGSTKNNEIRSKSVDEIFGGNEEEIQKQAEAYLAHSKKNYILFIPQFYKNQRGLFLKLIELLELKSTSSDKGLELAIDFLLKNKHTRSVEIPITKDIKLDNGNIETVSLIDLSWIPDKWWKLTTNTHQRGLFVRSINRVYFEICLFSCVSKALRFEDLYVEKADKYNDSRKQLVSLEEYDAEIEKFSKQIGYSSNSGEFITSLKGLLGSTISNTDKAFPKNNSVQIIKGKLFLHKIIRKPDPVGLISIERLITERLPELNILDVLSDTEYWLNWTSKFGPVSGLEDKLINPSERYITSTLCYGCNLGPNQIARSMDGIDRKQISYINQKHITEEKLLNANFDVINEYNKFALPKFWGSGKNASVDGTKWDIYEKNLLSEYHIRYGGWG